MDRRHIVVLSGAGMSAESGIPTFRGQGGLWENHRVETVASADAWADDPALVLRFYNQRRAAVRAAEPNAGHRALALLEGRHKVTIVTQNVDDLHERAGSTAVLHLHGEIMKARSTINPTLVYNLGQRDIDLGDTCDDGSQLRPHIVWFGEPVPLYHRAADIVAQADELWVVGTSLQVYPAAGLVDIARATTVVRLIDPAPGPDLPERVQVRVGTACEHLPKLVGKLLAD